MSNPDGLVRVRIAATLVVLFVVAAACVILLSRGCDGRRETRFARAPLPDSVVRRAVAPTESVPLVVTPAWRVYVDCSESMRGFTAKLNGDIFSTYTEVMRDLNNLLAATASDSYPTRFFEFGPSTTEKTGTSGHSPQQWFHTMATDSSAYKHANTDIGFVLGEVVDYQSPPEVALVITDGVQSTEKFSLNSELINEAARWLSWRYELGIIAVRSHFSGKAFSEADGDVPIGYYRGSRPFYIFVLATNRGGFAKVLNTVRSGITGKAQRADSVRSVMLSGRMLSDRRIARQGVSGRGNVFRGGQRPAGMPPVVHLRWTGDPAASGPGLYRVVFDIGVDEYARQMVPQKSIPRRSSRRSLATGGAIECAARAEALWLGDTAPAGPETSKVSVDVAEMRLTSSELGDRRLFDCLVRFDSVERPGKHALRCDIILPSDSLVMPAWVDSFSNVSDRNVADYDRTYNFDQLVYALKTRTSFNNQLIGSFYMEFHKPHRK